MSFWRYNKSAVSSESRRRGVAKETHYVPPSVPAKRAKVVKEPSQGPFGAPVLESALNRRTSGSLPCIPVLSPP
ncbi:2157_t:CDS:2 [Acaulospora colombiana]|uniref:2157_t:CDS:1 n=1 Tax=Acaulospora colombiana TaxID=27376 RepID=A0ACA9NH38_9GLOM|nr:2157_t:CDS:2 [Acaulospora colombiana]